MIPETSTTKKYWLRVFQPTHKEVLPHMVICRNFTTTMRHAPPKFLGLGILEFKIEQEIDKINTTLMNGTDNITMGLFLHNNM